MSNNVENNFFGFPKVKWLQYTGKVGKCTSYRCQIFSGFSIPKIIKIDIVIEKNKKVDVISGTQCRGHIYCRLIVDSYVLSERSEPQLLSVNGRDGVICKPTTT